MTGTSNDSSTDNDYIAAALPAFISEAEEQLDMLEQLLLQLEDQPGDRELLDALFRCAHTIKGSAGIFGLDDVVGFAHHVETLLDALRQGQVDLSAELSTLLLQSKDQIRQLIGAATGQPDGNSASDEAAREALVRRLQAASHDGSAGGAAQDLSLKDSGHAAATHPSSAIARRWQIAVAFGADTYRNGMDPLAILSYLGKLGPISAVVLDSAAVPPLDSVDPETCHLSVTLQLDTAAPLAEIESAFSFVRDDCTLSIREDAPAAAAAAPIANTPSDTPAQASAAPAPALAPAPASEQAPQAKPRQPSNSAATGGETRYIRVQADRLDAVINLLGELVIASAGAALLSRQTRSGALIEAHDLMGQLIEEIRNGTLQLRMVPIGETFSRFRRVVRDTAAELGKDVALDIVGADTELDKSVVELIADPLMHLVRNALDHGLETPQDRIAAGKPAQGKLTLSACHEAGSILIRIIDDGRGIQRDKVLQRAWDKGIVERGVTPPDDEVLKLIFQPGFSTAEKVTNLSGRGVGMDVVLRNIESLRGNVNLSSEVGEGSCIEIRLPLTLAIIDGFLIGVGASKFILPLDGVVEVIENRPTLTQLDPRGRGVVELRGQMLPVVSLRALYALESAQPERSSVVVIQAGARRFGVIVDQLHGQHQTVIKPLGRMFRSLRGISGSSILGTGEVALICDAESLSQLAADRPDAAHRAFRTTQANGAQSAPHGAPHGNTAEAGANTRSAQPSF